MNHKQEVGVGIFFFVLAALYLAGSLSIPQIDPFGNSALTSRAIPQLIGGLVALLSVIHIAGNIFNMKKARQNISLSEETARETDATDHAGGLKFNRTHRLMLVTVLLICAYIFLFTRLGFILSSVLFLLAEISLLIPAEKRKRWLVFIVCFSVGLPVLLYLLFTKPLSMFLPRGLLG
ncbi:MAG: tripartite tricarboxylate transporter TctB family protein [Spirochaetaceae bacterium]|jgi:putative tricarboxylic transport membrane protein|nr:tripartite tricarboxylate transporter TctB family protein [Spirochaetaceae bacterium]